MIHLHPARTGYAKAIRADELTLVIQIEGDSSMYQSSVVVIVFSVSIALFLLLQCRTFSLLTASRLPVR